MRVLAALTLALGMTHGAQAYGVSPGQYNQGATAPTVLAAAPQPSTYQAPAPGQPAQINITPQNPAPGPKDYDNMPVDNEYKAWKHYHWAEAQTMWEKKNALFIDARAKAEYDQGHIPGAIPLPLGEFDVYYEKYKTKIKSAKYLITYCHGAGCKLSDKVAQRLFNDKGHKNVGSFFGGWPQWMSHQMAVETGGEPKSR